MSENSGGPSQDQRLVTNDWADEGSQRSYRRHPRGNSQSSHRHNNRRHQGHGGSRYRGEGHQGQEYHYFETAHDRQSNPYWNYHPNNGPPHGYSSHYYGQENGEMHANHSYRHSNHRQHSSYDRARDQPENSNTRPRSQRPKKGQGNNPNKKMRNSRNDLTTEKSEVSDSTSQDNQATSLRNQIETNTYECMVCYDTINAFCATYSCFQCYNIFHLTCIRQWASSKLSDTTLPENATADWRCPACQVSSTSLPFRYLCYCGAVVNPQYKSFILPHSCGEKCSRVRETCSHKCPELCHPGKCPPCPSSVINYCLCGTESMRVKCSQKDVAFQCKKVCKKLLNCKKHDCATICHSGLCESCPLTNELVCYCGKSSKDIPCGSEKEILSASHTGYWSCPDKCSRPLMCGNHNCLKQCHSGLCQPCETDVNVITHCPCGKTKLEKITPSKRESCLDSIATCKKVCKKPLGCSTDDAIHFCQAICHNGPCPPCLDRSIVMCSCQSSSESMLCSSIPEGGLKCERVCYKKKSCGRHRCNTKCCLEDSHICMIPCGKLLSCKKHKCEELCHKGHCMPCLLSTFTEVYCTCGRTKLDPPVPCGADPPKCNEPCNREHSCPHPVTHLCHYEEQCPPCAQLVNKVCMGGHNVRFNIPCHVQDVSCGEMCKKPLPCGLHTCERWCHKGPCVTEKNACELPCNKTRILCAHRCNTKCHAGKNCPNNVCFEKIKIRCDCKRRFITVLCFKGATLTSETPDLTRYNAKLKGAGLAVAQEDLLDYLRSGTVKCSEKCKVEERNQRMAESLGLKDVPIDALVAPTYSDYLQQQAKLNKAFISEIENEFSTLILRYKKKNESADSLNKVKYIYHDFKVMNKDKRRTVHELAAVYKITSQSLDEEPHRNVQVRIGWDATEPSIKLSQYSQRRVIGGLGAKSTQGQTPTPPDDALNLQSLSLRTMPRNEIVFDNWEDISES